MNQSYGQDRKTGFDRRKAIVILCFLAAANLLGGIGLGFVVDRRLFWVAATIPIIALVLAAWLAWAPRAYRKDSSDQ